jgi:hypothetical protein
MLFVLVCWHLWKEQNARQFDQRITPVLMILDRISTEAELLDYRRRSKTK